ncbi:MAG: hypothetical protein Q4F67_01385 [Propionibacteriaceae bacterium]|nr:hypothetical protein [Propionibacteriaceae bacterium]
MSDPYRFAQAQSSGADESTETPIGTAKGSGARVLLWLLLVIGVIGNAVTSLGGAHPLVSLLFGILTVVTVVLLVVSYRKRRA